MIIDDTDNVDYFFINLRFQKNQKRIKIIDNFYKENNIKIHLPKKI